jgi:hypothetical protein
MKIQVGTTAAIFAAVVAACGSASLAQAGTVFSDNLTSSSSTVNGTSIPTGGNTTSYDIVSAKNSSADAITSTGLGLTLPVSSGAIVEAQAIFTTTPIILTNVGDNIDLTVTFNDKTGAPVATYFGLYNSGSTAPKTDLANGGLNSNLTNDATGGTQLYLGYNANVQNNTGTGSKIQSRPAQTGTTNTNQDLVSAGASPNQSYVDPIQLGSSTAASSIPISTGNTYTEDFLITVTAAASADGTTPIQYSFASNLYSGTSATGTPLATTLGFDPSHSMTPSAPLGYNSFDAFAFGYRENNSVAQEMDYTSVTVSSNVFSSQPLLGDANGDGKVDIEDLDIVLANLGTTTSLRSNGNFDGAATIDLTDLNDVLNNLTPAPTSVTATASAPEPASLSLLAMGTLLLTRRRTLK